MSKKIAVLAGDGIGPEIIREARKVLKAVETKFNLDFEYEEALMGACAIDATGNPLPDATLELCANSDAILFGAIGDPKYDNDPNAKVRPEQGLLKLRKELGLYANLRPVSAYKVLNEASPLKTDRIEGVDLIIYRELTGGSYFGEKGRSEDGESAFDTCTYSKYEVVRIAKLAFEAAQKRNKRLTMVDKANVMETSRLWREVVQNMEKDYPDVETDYMFIDNAAMKVILNPKGFDVVLTENMFGDILSDAASVITGSIGMLPSASVGAKTALFEPIHGSYPQVAGQNKANPMATILSAAMLLDSLAYNEAADAIRKAVTDTLEEGYCTEDINTDDAKTTSEVGDRIAAKILEEIPV